MEKEGKEDLGVDFDDEEILENISESGGFGGQRVSVRGMVQRAINDNERQKQ